MMILFKVVYKFLEGMRWKEKGMIEEEEIMGEGRMEIMFRIRIK